MKRTVIFSALIAGCLNIGVAAAQDHPNFSGPWVMDMKRSESAAQAADAAPRTPVHLAITHSPSTVSIRTTTDGKGETVSYTFDAPNRAAEDARVGTSGRLSPDREIDQSIARWDGAKLVTVTVYRVNGMSAKKTETRELSADGKEMTIETEMQMQHGYESDGKGPAGYGTAKDVYVREGR